MAATQMQVGNVLVGRSAFAAAERADAAVMCRSQGRVAQSKACSLKTSFFQPLAAVPQQSRSQTCRAALVPVKAEQAAFIEFIRGTKEQTVPEVRLTRSKDGSSGTATFIFDQPSVFEASTELGDITGLYMVDEEGVIQSIEVSAKFVNGRPCMIEARHIMRSEREWERFMRFMERYADAYGLGFTKKE